MEKHFCSMGHAFKISIVDDTAYFQLEQLKEENYKTFLLLLKNGFEYMCDNKVKYVKQYINEDDIVNFKKSEFLKNNDIVIVKTHIDDFLYELTGALGFNRL